MSALADLTAFVLGYCETHSEAGVSGSSAVIAILDTPVYADSLNRQAALYGFACGIGAADAEGFDPVWKPAGCI